VCQSSHWEPTDAETKIESSEFLKSGTGEYLQGFDWKTKSAEKQLIEGDMGACLSNPYQPLDLIHHKLVEFLGSSHFHHGEYLAEPSRHRPF
jgi:hypothetical protein